jgi:hypothetical protein
MSKRSIGMKREREVEKGLQFYGWITQRAPPSTRFSKHVDLMGLFDILAIRKNKSEGFGSTQLRKWIQVKTNKRPSTEWFELARKFKEKYCDEGDSIEVHIYWVRGKLKSKKGWEVIKV